MIRKDEVIRIGRLAKPHGVKGEIGLNFTDDVFDRCESPYLVCDVDGILVPFFMEEYRFKNDTTALVKFEGIDSEAEAREFAGREVYYPKRYADAEALEEAYTWAYFAGFRIVDPDRGEVGRVTEVDESTVNVLFRVENDGREILVPAAEDWIVRIDHAARVLYMQLPDGLIDLENGPDVF